MTTVPPNPSEPCEIVPDCPICSAGRMVQSTHVHGMYVCLCLSCGTSLSVPAEAMKMFGRRGEEST